MKIEDTIQVHPGLRQQARHRFYYLHETFENLLAQLNVSRLELEMMLRPPRLEPDRIK
jgi:hypothetical protein